MGGLCERHGAFFMILFIEGILLLRRLFCMSGRASWAQCFGVLGNPASFANREANLLLCEALKTLAGITIVVRASLL